MQKTLNIIQNVGRLLVLVASPAALPLYVISGYFNITVGLMNTVFEHVKKNFPQEYVLRGEASPTDLEIFGFEKPDSGRYSLQLSSESPGLTISIREIIEFTDIFTSTASKLNLLASPLTQERAIDELLNQLPNRSGPVKVNVEKVKPSRPDVLPNKDGGYEVVVSVDPKALFLKLFGDVSFTISPCSWGPFNFGKSDIVYVDIRKNIVAQANNLPPLVFDFFNYQAQAVGTVDVETKLTDEWFVKPYLSSTPAIDTTSREKSKFNFRVDVKEAPPKVHSHSWFDGEWVGEVSSIQERYYIRYSFTIKNSTLISRQIYRDTKEETVSLTWQFESANGERENDPGRYVGYSIDKGSKKRSVFMVEAG